MIGLDQVRLAIDIESLEIDSIKLPKNSIRRGEGIFIMDRAIGAYISLSSISLSIDNEVISIELLDVAGTQRIVAMISCPRLFYATNERNIYESGKLNSLFDIVDNRLIDVGFYIGKAAVSYLEVNITVQNEKLYGLTNIIRKAHSEIGNKVMSAECWNEVESLRVDTGRVRFKVYQKDKQIENKGHKPEQTGLIRFEVATDSTDELKNLLGESRCLGDLANQWTHVVEWYKKKLFVNLIVPIDRMAKQVETELIDDMRNGKPPSLAVKGSQYEKIFDMAIIDSAVKKYYRESGKKNPYSVIRCIHKWYRKENEDKYRQKLGNFRELKLLFDGLDYYIKKDKIPNFYSFIK